MQNKNLIRFVNSLIILPIATVSLPFNDINKTNGDFVRKPQIVLLQKENIGSNGLFALNQAEDPETKMKRLQAEAIDTYFKDRDMPLAGYGMKMVEEAYKNGLDWRLLPAIAVRESTGGKFACKKATFSAFGWGSCKINFDSHEHGIETVARNLGGHNPNTARYYAGKSTAEILKAYNPPSIVPKYVPQVMSIMEDIGSVDLGQTILES